MQQTKIKYPRITKYDYEPEVAINPWHISNGKTYDVIRPINRLVSDKDTAIAKNISEEYIDVINSPELVVTKNITTEASFAQPIIARRKLSSTYYKMPACLTTHRTIEVIRSTFDSNLSEDNIKNQTHPFSENHRITTEVLLSYQKVFDGKVKEDNYLRYIEVYDGQLFIANEPRINYRPRRTIGPQLPEEIKAYLIDCGELLLEFSKPIHMARIVRQVPSAREIIAEQSKFDELCSQMIKDIK